MAICAEMQGQKVGPSEDDASKTSKENKPHEEKKESILTKKESKKLKRNKGDKKGTEKVGVTKFEGEGIIFKAKLIGVEDIDEARGDQLCQDALHRLKAAVKSSGTHKTRITLSVSLEGIKIKDDRTGEILYHHPVHKISFISQDISDSRAFGYIFSLSQTGHQFVGVKTEKMAAHVVIALRDLFQTVLELKKQEMVKVETQQKSQTIILNDREYTTEETDSVTDSNSTEPIYSEVQERTTTEPIIDLLDLRTELDQLQEGIAQMNDSIAAYPLHVQQPILFPQKLEIVEENAKTSSSTTNKATFSEKLPSPQDKYAVFSEIDTVPSLFDNPSILPEVLLETNFSNDMPTTDPSELPQEKGASNSTAKPIDFSLFEDLDPLGKGRPFVSKENFFRNIKTPPKKTLKDFPGSSDSTETPPNSPNVPIYATINKIKK